MVETRNDVRMASQMMPCRGEMEMAMPEGVVKFPSEVIPSPVAPPMRYRSMKAAMIPPMIWAAV